MNVAPRREEILQRLKRYGYVSVTYLASTFEVDQSTIRRDLNALVEQGLAMRTSGGATTSQESAVIPYDSKTGMFVSQKQAIARAVVDRMRDGQTIMLDSGSTTYEVARLLDGLNDLTVVTNDLRIAMELSTHPDLDLIVTGGRQIKSVFTLVSDDTASAIADLNLDLCILGTDAVDPTGFSHQTSLEASAKRAMISQASQSILAVDHSKFGQRRLVRIATLEEIDLIITDDGTSSEEIANYPVEVLRVKTESP